VAEGCDDDVMASTSNSVEGEAAELGVRVWCDWGLHRRRRGGIGSNLVWQNDHVWNDVMV
jgi:hypothetical protein